VGVRSVLLVLGHGRLPPNLNLHGAGQEELLGLLSACVVLVLHGLVHADACARVASAALRLVVVMARRQHHGRATVRLHLVQGVRMLVARAAWLLLTVGGGRRFNRARAVPLLCVQLASVLPAAVVAALPIK